MGTLNAKGRKALPKDNFAVPATGSQAAGYPIEDKPHAVAALARVAKNGSPAEKTQVRAAVRKQYPDLPSSKGQGKSQAAAHNQRTARRAGKSK